VAIGGLGELKKARGHRRRHTPDLRRHHPRDARGIHHLLKHVGIGRAAGRVGHTHRKRTFPQAESTSSNKIPSVRTEKLAYMKIVLTVHLLNLLKHFSTRV
jgi:hypothetical protein